VRLGEILKAAQRQPILIARRGKDIAAIVSIADYERLRLADIESFLKVRRKPAGEVRTNGLTEDKLTELLSDDDH